MISRLRNLWPVRRLAAFAWGVWDAFLRDNKVIPPALAVLALFVFAWIVAGSFIGGPDDEPVSNRGEVAQTQDAEPPAPEIEAPDADSYAAYQSKDPFRQLFETAESDEATTQDDTDPDGSDPADDDTFDDPADDGTSDPLQDDDGDTSQGGPGGPVDDQYDDEQTMREDPTDAGDDDQTPDPATPAPEPDPDDLFDSGGDLPDPRGGARR
ncbi:MAG: hypothetical protein ACRDSJ_01575 [Rubrobacteraceae bacterium]